MKVEIEINANDFRRLQNVMRNSAQKLTMTEATLDMVRWGLVTYEKNEEEFRKFRSDLSQWLEAHQ